MTAPLSSLEKARNAKRRAVALYGDLEIVNGIGLQRKDGSYAIRINLVEEAGKQNRFRSRIAGIPVVLKVTGRVHKR